MPIIASAKSDGNFLPCPAGVHDAVAAFVVDMGHEYAEKWDKWVHKVAIVWEVNEPMADGRPFSISKRYTVSLSEKAHLRKDLEGWRGKKFNEAELAGFDLEVLKGKQCQLQVIHAEKNGKTYANIQTVLPRGKNSPTISVVATEVPEWLLKLKEENDAAYAKSDAAPVVILEERKPGVHPADDTGNPPF